MSRTNGQSDSCNRQKERDRFRYIKDSLVLWDLSGEKPTCHWGFDHAVSHIQCAPHSFRGGKDHHSAFWEKPTRLEEGNSFFLHCRERLQSSAVCNWWRFMIPRVKFGRHWQLGTLGGFIPVFLKIYSGFEASGSGQTPRPWILSEATQKTMKMKVELLR